MKKWKFGKSKEFGIIRHKLLCIYFAWNITLILKNQLYFKYVLFINIFEVFIVRFDYGENLLDDTRCVTCSTVDKYI